MTNCPFCGHLTVDHTERDGCPRIVPVGRRIRMRCECELTPADIRFVEQEWARTLGYRTD